MNKTRTTAPMILANAGDLEGSGHYRVVWPSSALGNTERASVMITSTLFTEEKIADMKPDTVIWQKHVKNDADKIMKQYRKLGCFQVLDFDDLVTNLPESNIHKRDIPKDVHARTMRASNACDRVTVSTEPLAEEMRKLTRSEVMVMPNRIPRVIFDKMNSADRSQNKKIRIGWAGGVSHTGDLKLIVPIMEALGDQFEWVFMGSYPEGASGDVHFVRPVPMDRYAETLANLNLDIALAPLEMNRYNECKSNLKLLEYGACGFPVIATDIYPYQNSPAITVPNDVDAWVRTIREIAADGDARKAAASSLHDWVNDNFILEDHLHDIETAYLPSGTALWDKIVPDGVKYISCLRPGYGTDKKDIDRLVPHLSQDVASVCAMSNDADALSYPDNEHPERNSHQRGDEINMVAAMVNDGLSADIPHPVGPAIILNPEAVEKIGMPSVQDYDSEEDALVEWGIRAVKAGYRNLMAGNVYAAAPHQKRDKSKVAKRIAARIPQFADVVSKSMDSESVRIIRKNVDMAMMNDQYTCPHPTGQMSYAKWYSLFGQCNEAEVLSGIQNIDDMPKVSIIMPTYNSNPEYLRKAIDSVMDQLYPNWELCIADDCSTTDIDDVLNEYPDPRIMTVWRSENGGISSASNTALNMADGKYVVFLDHDDTLSPDALYRVVRAFADNPKAKIVYSDSDLISEDGVPQSPYPKPDWNYELMLAQNYITHLCAYRLDTVNELGGFRPEYDGSQDYDLSLRVIDHSEGDIVHIPYILYHWRMAEGSMAADATSKPYAIDAARRAVLDHIQRTGQSAMVSPHPLIPMYQRVQFGIPADNVPRVSIIIPTKNNLKLLQECILSLWQKTSYSNKEIIIVDNGSTDKETVKFLREVNGKDGVRVIRYPHPFNYSAINNFAVTQATGDVLCLLNDDTRAISESWLSEMVSNAIRDGIGAVGAKLLFPNGTIQHAGVTWIDGVANHIYRNLPVNHPGISGQALLLRESMAVTAACLVVRKSIYEEVGGLDESFNVAYNDVDFCFRLREAGYRNLICPDALLFHFESQTRGYEDTPEKMRRHDGELSKLRALWPIDDPFCNPMVDQSGSLSFPPRNKEWSDDMVLMINPTDADMESCMRRGERVLGATFSQPNMLKISVPFIANMMPWNTRRPPHEAKNDLLALGVSRIVLCSLFGGDLLALPWIMNIGMPIAYMPSTAESVCPRVLLQRNGHHCGDQWANANGECSKCIASEGSEFGYVDPDHWKSQWKKFIAASTITATPASSYAIALSMENPDDPHKL